ncbi:MAG TPA: hypothetical protein PKD51_10020 [Saprospiraceae bacterium]|nr:hypothetical protein [Saprospiraceae bacterium]HMU04594.1 hypothetical protein [Saprospiraceae bacterium]
MRVKFLKDHDHHKKDDIIDMLREKADKYESDGIITKDISSKTAKAAKAAKPTT